MIHPFCKSEGLEKALGLGTDFAVRAAGDEPGDHYVFKGIEFRKKVVKLEDEANSSVAEFGECAGSEAEDVGIIDDETAGVRGGKGTEYLEEGRFAGSAGTHDGYDFGFLHFEVYSLEDFKVPETFFYSLCLDYHIAFLWEQIYKNESRFLTKSPRKFVFLKKVSTFAIPIETNVCDGT